jgi:FkbM family methyltransferase
MKNLIISFLQKLLGFENYLFVFSLFIICKLRWDKSERDFLKLFELLDDEGIVIDIGANIGVMTAHFAKRLKNSKILSFEPIPCNIKTIQKVTVFLKLKNVHIIETALSDFNGHVDMIMPVINSARKQGLSHIKDREKSKEAGETFRVAVKKLDDVNEIASLQEKIIAIKIDVEGHELRVLKGAVSTIRKHKPVIYCELWEGEQREKTIGFMKSLNYEAQVLVKNNFTIYKDQTTQNFFFIPVK